MKIRKFKIRCTAYITSGPHPQGRMRQTSKTVEVMAREKWAAVDLARYKARFDRPDLAFRSYEFLPV